MPDVDRECPVCGGEGGSWGTVCGVREGAPFSEDQRLPCPFCRGRGRVAVAAGQAYERGRALAADRIKRRVTLRQEAERLGISPQELSHREWGRG